MLPVIDEYQEEWSFSAPRSCGGAKAPGRPEPLVATVALRRGRADEGEVPRRRFQSLCGGPQQLGQQDVLPAKLEEWARE